MTKQSKLHPADTVVRTEEILSNTVDSETILLHMKNSKYYGMDPIGSRIWEFLGHPIKVQAIILNLVEEYDVAAETCEQDVLLFLSQLLEEKLVQRVDV